MGAQGPSLLSLAQGYGVCLKGQLYQASPPSEKSREPPTGVQSLSHSTQNALLPRPSSLPPSFLPSVLPVAPTSVCSLPVHGSGHPVPLALQQGCHTPLIASSEGLFCSLISPLTPGVVIFPPLLSLLREQGRQGTLVSRVDHTVLSHSSQGLPIVWPSYPVSPRFTTLSCHFS